MAIPKKNDVVRRSKRKREVDSLGDSKPPAKISRRSPLPKKAASNQEEDGVHGGEQHRETPKPPSPADLSPRSDHGRPMDSLTADWSSLPNDLLMSIATRLKFLDYIGLTGACSPWRSILSERQITPHPQRPWFMLDFKCFSKTFWFVTLHGEFHGLRLPESSSICGSSRGWLMVSTRRSRKFRRYYLLNPFSMAKVALPSMPPFAIASMVLSSSPTSEGCTIMAVGDCRQVAFLSMDSPTWRCIPLQQSMGIDDAVFFEGRFYFITGKGSLGFFDKGITGGSTRWVKTWLGLRNVRKPPGRRVRSYLTVGPDGQKLLLVRRHFRRGECDRRTFGADVFAMRTDMKEWKATTFFPDEALFLSEFSSISFAANEHRRLHACSFFGNRGEDWWGYEQKYPKMAQLFSKVGNLQLVAPYL
ncbi:unnamed protein product [Victoria cruziana]